MHFGREWSLFDWADRCAEARKVGFSGLGIWHADLEHVLETRRLAEMKRVLDDNGLRHLELEFLMDWFLDPDDERRSASDETRELLFEAAGVLDAHHIKVGQHLRHGRRPSHSSPSGSASSAPTLPAHRREDRVRARCRPTTNVQTLDAVLEVVGARGAANGGIAIDTWHMSKLGIAPDELRRIPLEYLWWVELSDGQIEDMDDPMDEVVNHRRLPGEGEFDIRGYIKACRDHGYAGPWGVEVLSEELRNNPIDVIFRRAYETTAAQFEHERSRREHTEGVEKLDRDRLVWIFEQMLRIREFEERVKRTFLDHPGVIRGHTHLADGAEASIVGSIATLGPTTSSSRRTAATATRSRAAPTRRR